MEVLVTRMLYDFAIIIQTIVGVVAVLVSLVYVI